jgi:hypothetical protein
LARPGWARFPFSTGTGTAGVAEDLDKAKKAVEYAVLMADKQMDLFNG